MSRLRRILKDDIESFDLDSLMLTAAILLLCLVGVSLVHKGDPEQYTAAEQMPEPGPAR